MRLEFILYFNITTDFNAILMLNFELVLKLSFDFYLIVMFNLLRDLAV